MGVEPRYSGRENGKCGSMDGQNTEPGRRSISALMRTERFGQRNSPAMIPMIQKLSRICLLRRRQRLKHSPETGHLTPKTSTLLVRIEKPRAFPSHPAMVQKSGTTVIPQILLTHGMKTCVPSVKKAG